MSPEKATTAADCPEPAAEARTAIVVRGVGGYYWIRTPDGEVGKASPRGIFRQRQTKLLPGDYVRYEPVSEGDPPFYITEILPRQNVLPRPPMANLDGMLAVFSLARPDPDLLLLDKLLCLAEHIRVPVRIIFTKWDLAPELGTKLQAIYRDVAEMPLLSDGEDPAVVDAVQAFCAGKTVTVAGPSGAGKSTLVNRVFGRDHMATGDVQARSGMGKQTTRHVELIPHATGYLADSPGFQALTADQMEIETEDLLAAYHDLGTLDSLCRFHSCRHLSEPGCGVKAKVEAGEADPGRLERYQYLREQLDAVTHW